MARRAMIGVAMAVGMLLACVPGAHAAEVQAAYDFYVPGQGFQIGLVNAGTGAARPLPAGVNTTDDELHPALSPDGRWLAFTRMRIVPKLDGSFPVPTDRNIVLVDLQASAVVPFGPGVGGAGPTFLRSGFGAIFTDFMFGLTPARGPGGPAFDGNARIARDILQSDLPTGGGAPTLSTELRNLEDVYVPHAGIVRGAFRENLLHNTICTPTCSSPREIRYLTLANFNSLGTPGGSTVRMTVVGPPDNASTIQPTTLKTLDIGGALPAGHATPRAGDNFVAMDRNTGSDSDIHSMDFPLNTSTTPAPAPITTQADERFPAWSPDGLKLAFVRTTGGRRQLGVYDLTPGIQAITATIDLGPDTPTSQTRVFHNVWGGISLGEIPATPAVTCDIRCRAKLTTLTPTITLSTVGQRVGIFVVRRTGGTKTVLGVKQPKIKVIGRVPLGKTKKGRNRFRWDGKVGGKPLKPGKYLLTYRLLRDDAVTSVSKSIPFTVGR